MKWIVVLIEEEDDDEQVFAMEIEAIDKNAVIAVAEQYALESGLKISSIQPHSEVEFSDPFQD